MAKKSLKKRIDDLVHALGGAKKPSLAEIRGELVEIGALVECLENEQALAEKSAAIAALEAETENLMAQLQGANAELEAFRNTEREQKEQDRKKDLPDIQFAILRGLPTEHIGDGATLKGISLRGRIRPDEAAVHLARLEKAGFAQQRKHYSDAAGIIVAWHRTIAGDELILAKRLAGEETDEQKGKSPKLPNRSQWEDIILMVLARPDAAMTPNDILSEFPQSHRPAVLPFLAFLLELKDRHMVAPEGDERDCETVWRIRPRGLEYLSERGLAEFP